MSKLQREIQHFDKLPHIWWGARTIAGQKRYDHKLSTFKKLCKPKPNSQVLEIGCGDGEFTRRLLTTKAKIIATDITPGVVARGKKTLVSPNLKFKVVNCEKLPFKDNSFDIVCGISILHHVNPLKTLKEALRVLKPGGQIYFTEPNMINPHIFLILHLNWLRKLSENSPDETALTRWQMTKMLKKIGYQQVVVKNYDFLHPLTPKPFVKMARELSDFLETLPFIQEISGSLIIHAKK